MIAIGLVCWIETDEQLPELQRCLDSLTDFYPVIVVNGKWNDFNGINPRSTIQANDLIDSYSNVVHIQSPDRPEWYNRNLCLTTASKMGYDELIWVDTDEYIEMPLGKEFFLRGIDYKDKQVCYIHYYDESKGGVCRMKRLIRDIGNVKLSRKHNEWLNGDVDIFKDPADAPRGLVIKSDNLYRSESRISRMKIRNKDNPIH